MKSLDRDVKRSLDFFDCFVNEEICELIFDLRRED